MKVFSVKFDPIRPTWWWLIIAASSKEKCLKHIQNFKYNIWSTKKEDISLENISELKLLEWNVLYYDNWDY